MHTQVFESEYIPSQDANVSFQTHNALNVAVLLLYPITHLKQITVAVLKKTYNSLQQVFLNIRLQMSAV